MQKQLLIRISIVTVSILGGCSGIPRSPVGDAYRAGPALRTASDPLVPKKDFPLWNPPKQFALWVHPHKDRDQGVLIGGHWILENLTEGDWYIEEFTERDPVPDGESSSLEAERARASFGDLSEFVVPYRVPN